MDFFGSCNLISKNMSECKEIVWDAEEWIEKQNDAKRDRINGYHRIRQNRAEVFQNTANLVNQGYYEDEDNNIINFKNYPHPSEGTVFYKNKITLEEIAPTEQETIIEVINDDCLEVGKQLKLNEGLDVAILNMASRTTPGGGCRKGCMAQEEQIFYRTNIFQSLFPFSFFAKDYGLNIDKENQYPLQTLHGAIYTPQALLFRNNEQKGYSLMDKPIELAFISVAAIRRPELENGKIANQYLIDMTKERMRTIFRIGLQHKHNALVLGAWGCGAYKNPPRHIAQLFKEVLEEEEFKNKFVKIVFAILEDYNSKQNTKEGNLKPFIETFN